MKHYFIANPASGQKDKGNIIDDAIIPAAKKTGIDYEIYYTKAPRDAVSFVRSICEKSNGEKVRFYAVGGDGTLYEVINGAIGFPNAEIAVVPIGSGNDWIRIFGDQDIFLDLEGNINGIPLNIDCIKATDDKGNSEISITEVSMGFDAESCNMQGEMKKLPFVSGHMSYIFGGLYCMFTKVWNDFEVEVDGKKYTGPYLFAIGCNGQYYGSGIHVAQYADPEDGKLDFLLMRRVISWPFMFRVMMFHWQEKFDFNKYSYCEQLRGEKMVIRTKKPGALNVDGECHPTTEATVEVVKKGLTFVVPQGSTYFEDKKNGTFKTEIEYSWRQKEPAKSILLALKPFDQIVNKRIMKVKQYK